MSGITVVGDKELNATLKELAKDIGNFSMSALIAGGKAVEGSAKKSIQGKSSGKIVTRYRKGGASYEHVAAGPGQAPNTDRGDLVKSINTEPTKDAVFVGTSQPHGAFQEFGTKDMEPRPWLMPALDLNTKLIIDLQIDAVNKSIKANQHGV